METNNNWQRFHLERVQCEKCGKFSIIANPTLSDLYVCTSERRKLISKSFDIPQVRCPNCNEKFERIAIWAKLDEKL